MRRAAGPASRPRLQAGERSPAVEVPLFPSRSAPGGFVMIDLQLPGGSGLSPEHRYRPSGPGLLAQCWVWACTLVGPRGPCRHPCIDELVRCVLATVLVPSGRAAGMMAAPGRMAAVGVTRPRLRSRVLAPFGGRNVGCGGRGPTAIAHSGASASSAARAQLRRRRSGPDATCGGVCRI